MIEYMYGFLYVEYRVGRPSSLCRCRYYISLKLNIRFHPMQSPPLPPPPSFPFSLFFNLRFLIYIHILSALFILLHIPPTTFRFYPCNYRYDIYIYVDRRKSLLLRCRLARRTGSGQRTNEGAGVIYGMTLLYYVCTLPSCTCRCCKAYRRRYLFI